MDKNTQVIVLAGANTTNREWAEKLSKSLRKVFKNVELFEYSHWTTANEINISKEVNKLIKRIKSENAEVYIVAKSAGSLISLIGMPGLEQVKKAIFIGFPIEYAKEKKISLAKPIDSLEVTTLCIQANADPFGSAQQVAKLFSDNTMVTVQSVAGDSHQYSDIDDLVSMIQKFTVRGDYA